MSVVINILHRSINWNLQDVHSSVFWFSSHLSVSFGIIMVLCLHVDVTERQIQFRPGMRCPQFLRNSDWEPKTALRLLNLLCDSVLLNDVHGEVRKLLQNKNSDCLLWNYLNFSWAVNSVAQSKFKLQIKLHRNQRDNKWNWGRHRLRLDTGRSGRTISLRPTPRLQLMLRLHVMK